MNTNYLQQRCDCSISITSTCMSVFLLLEEDCHLYAAHVTHTAESGSGRHGNNGLRKLVMCAMNEGMEGGRCN